MNTLLELDAVTIAYGTGPRRHTAVDALSVTLARGAIGCLLGASGCGKTTVLRAIAGFEPVHAGRILLDGAIVASPAIDVPPERRQIGMMFQDYALFPHLSVADNVGFGLRRTPKAERRARVAAMLELVGLARAGGAYPHELSGGQQQRVALARALAPGPTLLLLDEPFSNLDVDMRERLAFELRDILKETGHTALVVTHNHAEAFAIGDRIGVMRDGRLAQWDTPEALHRRPADAYVAEFVRRDALAARRAQALARAG